MEIGDCESCGSPDCDDLVRVRRLYVVNDGSGAEPEVTRVDGTEVWCSACRTHYPHEVTT